MHATEVSFNGQVILTLVGVWRIFGDAEDCESTTFGYLNFQSLHMNGYGGNTTIATVAAFVLCQHQEVVVQVFRQHIFANTHEVVFSTIVGVIVWITCSATGSGV